jgi:hypothetical protein
LQSPSENAVHGLSRIQPGAQAVQGMHLASW